MHMGPPEIVGVGARTWRALNVLYGGVVNEKPASHSADGGGTAPVLRTQRPDASPAHRSRRFVRVDTDDGPRVGYWDADTVEILDHDDQLAALHGSGDVVAHESLADLRLLAPIHAPRSGAQGSPTSRAATRASRRRRPRPATCTRSSTTRTGPNSS
jgi:hypothetical protein